MRNRAEYFASLHYNENDGWYIEAKVPVAQSYVKDVLEKGRIIYVDVPCSSTYKDNNGVLRCSYCGCDVKQEDAFCEACGVTLED